MTVRGSRRGGALHVRVLGLARARQPGSSFEKPERWDVLAEFDGVRLDRILNGSSRVTREGTKHPDRWDVTVSFDTAFRLPTHDAHGAPVVVVTPPGATPRAFTVAAER